MIKIGDVVTNADLASSFGVGNMGGMRRSRANNCLVIISDHTKGLYDDRWYGDVLHYTGMGKKGDQTLEGNQNKTLFESNSNGITVHLFEVLNPSEYTYHGVVTLAEPPYQEEQPDEDGNNRKVWMFPVKPTGPKAEISAEKIEAAKKRKTQKVEKLSTSELKKAAKDRSTDNPGNRTVKSVQKERDEFVSEYAKRLAGGICSLCKQPAPFKKKDGSPYLETHHVIWLANGGSDSIDNTVALCPNCHRKMHVVNDPSDVTTLKQIAEDNAKK